jgi:hypothetical protein
MTTSYATSLPAPSSRSGLRSVGRAPAASAAPALHAAPQNAAATAVANARIEIADDHVRVALAVEWLEQAVAGVPVESAARATLVGYLGELTSLLRAAERVQTHASSRAVGVMVERNAPVFAYLKALYAWCEGLAGVIEEIASCLRRNEPVRAVFLLRRVNESHARLEGLARAIEASIRAVGPAAVQLDADVEELCWAASWLHVSLTKRFGE